jgi:hypothetical protein
MMKIRSIWTKHEGVQYSDKLFGWSVIIEVYILSKCCHV